MAVEAVPNNIGRYVVKSELRRGGQGTVYVAHDPHFNREVALKLLPIEFLHDPTFRERFDREAQTLAALEHYAIVPVYDYGKWNEQPYIVMRLMSGGNLADRIAGDPMPYSEISPTISRLASALDKAHSQGIIHRDIKPGNILFDDEGKAYLSDFGTMKFAESASNVLTATGTTLGTPAYMSPEQARAVEKIDGRSDVYSLGIVLYEMLTGERPFNADTPMGLAMMHILEPVPRVLDAKKDLDPAFGTIITKALAKDRKDRYPDAKGLAQAVTAASLNQVSDPTTAMKTELGTPNFVNEPKTIKVESKRKTPIWPIAAFGIVLFIAAALFTVVVVVILGGGGDGDTETTDQISEAIVVLPTSSASTAVIETRTIPPTETPISIVSGDFTGMVNVPGNYQLAAGCKEEWDAACEATALNEGEDGLFTASHKLPAGIYEVKVALDGSLETNYGAEGIPEGDNYGFRVDADGIVNFSYDPATHVLTIEQYMLSISAEPTIEYSLPKPVTDALENVKVDYYDDFEEYTASKWDFWGQKPMADGVMLLRNGDPWETGIRYDEALKEGNSILISFYYEKQNPSPNINSGKPNTDEIKIIGVQSGAEDDLRHHFENGSSFNYQPKTDNLILKENEWYSLLIAIGTNAEFLSLVWQMDDPSYISKYLLVEDPNWQDQTWFFDMIMEGNQLLIDDFVLLSFDEIIRAPEIVLPQDTPELIPTLRATNTSTPTRVPPTHTPPPSATPTETRAPSGDSGGSGSKPKPTERPAPGPTDPPPPDD